ncbi:MAG: RidA family protein [Woeseia sp.]
MSRKVIHSDNAPAAIGTYSQAVEVNGLVFMSGQLPLDPVSMEIVEGDFAARAHQVFKNMTAICEAAGGSTDDIVKVNIFLTDLSSFATVNEVMAEYFTEPYPARAAIGVASLPKGTDIEAEAVLAAP